MEEQWSTLLEGRFSEATVLSPLSGTMGCVRIWRHHFVLVNAVTFQREGVQAKKVMIGY